MKQLAFKVNNNKQNTMERPLMHDLQYLLNKLTEHTPLNSTDVNLLDKAYSFASTEMANLVSQILMVISESPQKQFWESFSSVINCSQSKDTVRVIHWVLNKRIGKQWHQYDSSIHQGIKLYVVQNITKYLQEDNHPHLHSMNQLLVSIMKCQIQSLFKDFVNNLEIQGADLPTNKLINNLNILRILLEEGFSPSQPFMSPSESYEFKQSLDSDMRTILRVLCLYLQSNGVNRKAVINKCLQILRCSIEYIPAFELFNCHLIEILAGLIGQVQFHEELIICFEEIFRFKECNASNNNHSKIVKKLLLILQIYLQRFQNSKGFDYNQMDNASTEESFRSGKTKVKNSRQSQQYRDLLNLIYQFLIRYVPFMDKARGQQDLDIEYQGNIKIYFSQDLYESLALIYWRLLQFLQNIVERLDPFQIQDDEYVQERRKALCCIRLMIQMLTKLKINARQQVKIAIQTTVLNFTPLSPQFVHYYLQFDILQKGMDIATEPPFFSPDIQQEYKEFISAILKEISIMNLYFQIVQEIIEDSELYVISEKERRIAGFQAMQNKQLQRYVTLKTINSMNRVCWSAVYAYHCNYQAMIRLPIAKLSMSLAKSTNLQKSVELQRCFNLNSRYLAQIYYPNSTIYIPLFSSLQVIKNETVIQFSLLLLSKIFMNDSVSCNVSFQELKMTVQKLHEIELLDVTSQTLIKMYPALINLLIRKMQQTTSDKEKLNKLKDILSALIRAQVDSLRDFSKISDTRDHIDLQRSILVFKKIKYISQHLTSMFKNNKVIKNCTYIVNWLRTAASMITTEFQFKNRMFCQYLRGVNFQHFDIIHILKFRKYYVQLIRSMLVFLMIMENNDAKEFKNSIKLKKQTIDTIKTAQSQLKMDFLTQQQFKVKEFLQFEIDYYQWYLANEPQTSQEVINNSLSQILQNLKGWSGDYEIAIQKYKFAKEVVRIFALKLSRKSIHLLMGFFEQIEQNNIQPTSIELIIETFHQLLTLMVEDSVKTSKKIVFDNFTSLFFIVFQRLFCSTCQKEPIYSKLANLFYMQLEISRDNLIILSKKDNLSYLYVLLQNHITDKTNIQFQEQNSNKLSLVFTEKKLSKWMNNLKEYVVYLTRLTKTN